MVAHINDKNKRESVVIHVKEVAEYSRKTIEPYGFANLIYLVGVTHDIGKQTEIFREYIEKAHKDPKSVAKGSVNHSSAGGKYIFDRYYKGSKIAQLTAQILSFLVVSHHGLTDCLSVDGKEKFMARVHPQDEIYYEEAINNSSDFLHNQNIDILFENAMSEVQIAHNKMQQISKNMANDKKINKENLLFLHSCLERFLLSALIDADRTCTASFMMGISVESITKCSDMQTIWSQCQEKLERKLNEFTKNDKISNLRRTMSRECLEFASHEAGIYTLPIPTGGGKTFAAFRFALEHAIKKKKERIIYIAPFLSILEQNSKELKDVFQMDGFILEHHSNIVRDKSDSNNEGYDKYQLLIDTWNSPLIFTTMVQFLDTLFSDRTQCLRRMNKLADSVIIIDEIQSIPIKCVHMFNIMMNFLAGMCNTTIILCSATQPLLGEVKRKILYSNPSSMIKDIEGCSKAFERVNIIPSLIQGGYDSIELTDFIMDKFELNMLIILNTKAAVRNLYNELKGKISDEIEVVQLTTYMCAAHRGDVIKNLKEKLKHKKKVICISTQLIEAGVDISFQCVVRSLAGLDSVAQAAGRCNRHGELDMGIVYVINSKDENLDKLQEIRYARDVMEYLIRYFELSPEVFDNSLLSRKAMDFYYNEYIFKNEDKLDYPLDRNNNHPSTSLFDLLSKNTIGSIAYKERNGSDSNLPLKQAFQYAGSQFEVIGNHTIGIIVPYKEAIQYIENIRNSYDMKYIAEEMKKLQPYTINVYEHDKQIQEISDRNGIDSSVLEGRILILERGFYDLVEGAKDNLELQIY